MYKVEMTHKVEECYLFVLHELKKYLKNANIENVVIGLSGGIDSALVATMAADALGSHHVHTVMMASPYTSTQSIRDASEISENLKAKHTTVRIDKVMNAFKTVFLECIKWEAQDITEQNLQSRIRGVILMGIANKTGSMVLATSNKSEILMGYFTLYGDSCGGYAPLSSFLKTQVYELARWRNENAPKKGEVLRTNIIPESVLKKPPTAELKHNQKDSDTLPEYKLLDKILAKILSNEDPTSLGVDKEIVDSVVKRMKNFEYKKRYLPIGPALEVTEW